MKTRLVTLALGAAWLGSTAIASSPAAWSVHDKEVAEACTKASGLNAAKVAGTPIAFDDAVGITAWVVTGRYPQPHMKNQRARVLCLFDRRKREASVTPADQLRVSVPSAQR
ncbi:hypothetical protein [Polaromonas sp. YR568]|uniref:hypothetical protein n=1 Tax=Polaromonas sp. YR568 TaxID=1855301 RepID=UPI003137C5E6